jgi:quercetin dioxygenase-like cupin family protein
MGVKALWILDMETSVEHWDSAKDGELNEANLRAKLEAHGYSVHRYVYAPGTYFPDHTHGIDKIDGVLSGRFKMTMGGQELILEAGDCLAVPAGAVHSAEVIGNESVISLDVTKK